MKINSNTSRIILLCVAFATLQEVRSQSAEIRKSSGYAPVNGLEIYYEVHEPAGSTETLPLVLLHGMYMTIELNWSQWLPNLAKDRKVIALELQGHGRTADTDRPLSYSNLASDVAGVVKYLKLEKTDVMGYSYGGTVALQMAVDHSELINKLVILSTSFKTDGWLPEALAVFNSFEPSFLNDTPLKAAYDSTSPHPKHWEEFVNKMIAFDKLNYSLSEANVRAIQAPVLLVMGDNDGVSMQHKMEFYKLLGGDVFGDMAGLPKSQLAILPGTTHWSLMMEAETILSYINPFLNSNNPKPLY